MEKVFEFESIHEDTVKFDPTLPPIFDDYHEEKTLESIMFQDQSSYYLVDFQTGRSAAAVKEPFFSICLFDNMVRVKLLNFVHGR